MGSAPLGVGWGLSPGDGTLDTDQGSSWELAVGREVTGHSPALSNNCTWPPPWASRT